MKSMWNNVKYGWTIKTKTNFKYDSPIFLLGRCYHRRAEAESSQQEQEGHMHQTQQEEQVQQHYRISALDEFNADFTSRLWFTYRREFTPIGSSKMTTDCGWGCMLRSGQMMMAQALVQHFLGRDWRVYSEQKPEDLTFYREIIRWFGDYPSDKMPFSLHHLVELGTSVGKMPGDWYGPASVAHILRDALVKAYQPLPLLQDVSVYVTQDCTIYVQDLINLVSQHPRKDLDVNSRSFEEETSTVQKQLQQTESEQKENWRAVIILIPMRLGGEALNQIYIPCVKSMLAHDNCIGIIGGKPKHSLYFIGWQDDKMIYLDPHYCQDVVDTTKPTYPIQSFHCMSPRKILFTKMDPSCTVGFYCRNKEELQTFLRQVPDMVVPPRQKGQYPLFVVTEGTSSEMQSKEPPYRELGRLHIRHVRCDQDGNRIRAKTVDSDDFVIL
ncbi:cysteine protease ATG4D-like isoform X1 [Pomacea canaliculata]|uniref:cysteine protease ATG4D-like isoform X1 n=1 Tax=Pomacea canaliculata TaxID=400727 RepID=UPI000D7358FD|nr:cysteine protease ATG4D-like isoform X1 [Pomacea canaliculata]